MSDKPENTEIIEHKENSPAVEMSPMELMNKAIEKGKGKPHLAPADNTMAQGNNLAAAMLIAPLAGAAAAVGKYYNLTKKGGDQNGA